MRWCDRMRFFFSFAFFRQKKTATDLALKICSKIVCIPHALHLEYLVVADYAHKSSLRSNMTQWLCRTVDGFRRRRCLYDIFVGRRRHHNLWMSYPTPGQNSYKHFFFLSECPSLLHSHRRRRQRRCAAIAVRTAVVVDFPDLKGYVIFLINRWLWGHARIVIIETCECAGDRNKCTVKNSSMSME